MTAKPRWVRSRYGQVFHLAGDPSRIFHGGFSALCRRRNWLSYPLILTRFVPDYTPTEGEQCPRCRKLAAE